MAALRRRVDRLLARSGARRRPALPLVDVLVRSRAERNRLAELPLTAVVPEDLCGATMSVAGWEAVCGTRGGGVKHQRRGLYDKQLEFRRLRTPFRGFCAGRGAGKTDVGADFVLRTAKGGEPWMCVSPDNNVILDTTWPTFESIARETGRWIRGVKTPVPRIWFQTSDAGVAEVVFKSAERPDKLRGSSKAGLWFDEGSVMSHEAFTTALPVLRWRGKSGPCLLTFTPRGRNSWTFSVFFQEADDEEVQALEAGGAEAELLGDLSLYQEFGGRWYRRRENAGFVHARSAENPFLPAEYQDQIGGHLSATLRLQELGGEFVEIEGLMFARQWFYPLVDVVPRDAARVRFWDRAAGTLASSCRTAGVLMARTNDGLFWIEDVKYGKWSADERNRIMVETARADAREYGNRVQIWGEQEGGSAGKEISEQFIKMLAGFPVYREIVSGRGTRKVGGQELPGDAKVIRAQGLAAQAEAGNVRVRRAKFTDDVLCELCAFPESEYADIVDACAHALNKLCQQWTTDPGPTYRIEQRVDGERFGIHLDRGGGTGRRGEF